MADAKSIHPVSQLYKLEKESPSKVYLRQPVKGQWHERTWSQTMDEARRIAAFMEQQDVKRGDRVASLSKNTAEWFITDFACLIAGIVHVPLYASQSADDIRFILEDSEAKLIFVGKLDTWDQQETGIPEHLIRIAMPYETMPADYHWHDIVENYAPVTGTPLPKLDDVMTIMYTSGSTGRPKGVVFTYRIIHELTPIMVKEMQAFDLPCENHFLSYLPLAHIAERSFSVFTSIYLNADVSFVESLDTFADNLHDTSPTIFFAVPRIWTIFQHGILKKIPQRKLSLLLKIPLASWLLKQKIKKTLGFDQTVIFASGSAAIAKETLAWWQQLDITILEIYGQTENWAYATTNTHAAHKIGTVGRARTQVEVKISDRSELLIKSPGNMLGYYKQPELTAATLTDDGFLHTGDMAKLDEAGYISIIGRIKEQFKTTKGEYIIPVPIEEKFSGNEDIEHLCLVGSGLKQPVLLVSLSELGQKKDRKQLSNNMKKYLKKANHDLTNFERISHVLIDHFDWTAENELLTSTLKLKRHNIEQHYANDLKKLKNINSMIVWREDLAANTEQTLDQTKKIVNQ